MIENFKEKNYKRIWLITDTHFGARSNSAEWSDIMFNYLENDFLTNLKNNYKNGDVLVHCGDVFDNRQTISLKILNRTLSLFEKITKILDVYIIVGNHDIWHKNSNEVSSVDVLKWVPNLQILKDFEILNWSNKRVVLMPWRKDTEHEIETLSKIKKCDYLFCHSEVKGVLLNSFNKNEHGNDIDVFKHVTKVFSGHIHIRQQQKNVHFLGNPYQMTRSDAYNPKGVNLLDLNTGDLTFYENETSPKFIKFNIEDFSDFTLEDFKKIISNNFVDIFLNPDVANVIDLTFLTTHLDNVSRKIDFLVSDFKSQGDTIDLDSNYTNYSIKDIINMYIDDKFKDDEQKEKVKNYLDNLYNTLTDN